MRKVDGDEGPTASVMDLSCSRVEAHFDDPQAPYAVGRGALHLHPHFELLYITAGVREFEIESRRHRAEAGDLLIFRPGEEHVEFAGTPTISYFVLRFHAEELAAAGAEFPSCDTTGPVVTLPDKQGFHELFQKMTQERDNPSDDSELLLGVYLVEFTVKLRRAVKVTLPAARPDAIPSPVRHAMDLMHRRLAGHLDLERLARGAFMSVSNFSRVFKESVGQSPKKFLIQKRIEMAKELLASSPKTAEEIAAELGYRSPYFFYRQFRQKTGMTTVAFRRLHRGGK